MILQYLVIFLLFCWGSVFLLMIFGGLYVVIRSKIHNKLLIESDDEHLDRVIGEIKLDD